MCISVDCRAQIDTLQIDDGTSVTTAPVPAPAPVPTIAPFPTVHYAAFVQSVPIMEVVGLYAEMRVDDPFGKGWLKSTALSGGIGYSIYTPSFVPLMLRTLWGNKHLLEVAIGTSIPMNRVYGTNATKPLTWPVQTVNPTILVGYRHQGESSGVMYRVFIQTLSVPKPYGGLLPCLGASIGYSF